MTTKTAKITKLKDSPSGCVYEGPGSYEMRAEPYPDGRAAGEYCINPCDPLDSSGDWFKISARGQPDIWVPTGYLNNYIIHKV